MEKINSKYIQEYVESWAKSQNFNAPYGVLNNSLTNQNGTKYLSVTFGRARTLDATLEIYNKNFMIAKTSRHGRVTLKSFPDLVQFLNTL